MAHTASDFVITGATGNDIALLNNELAYLDSSFAGNTLLNGLQQTGQVIALNHSGNDGISVSGGVIDFDPTAGHLISDDGVLGVQSAAIGLAHEIAHVTNPDFYTDTPPQAEQYAMGKETALSRC